MILLRLVVAACLACPALLAQCAMCRRALVSSAEGRVLTTGFNQGIVFLLAVPFLLVGGIGLLIYRGSRRGRMNPWT